MFHYVKEKFVKSKSVLNQVKNTLPRKKITAAEKRARKNKSSFWVRRTVVV